jgi:hypothetical protein
MSKKIARIRRAPPTTQSDAVNPILIFLAKYNAPRTLSA